MRLQLTARVRWLGGRAASRIATPCAAMLPRLRRAAAELQIRYAVYTTDSSEVHWMRYLKILRILGSLIGAIALGAVGSGVWDLFLKRFVLLMWGWTATIAGLLVSSIRDAPYQDAARASPHDTMLYLALLLACAWFGYQTSKIDPVWVIPESATPEESATIYRRWRRIARFLTFVAFFFAVFQIGQARATYQIADDFRQNIDAIAPFVDPKEAAALRFAFTHMKPRNEYLALIARMAGHAKAAGVELPRRP